MENNTKMSTKEAVDEQVKRGYSKTQKAKLKKHMSQQHALLLCFDSGHWKLVYRKHFF